MKFKIFCEKSLAIIIVILIFGMSIIPSTAQNNRQNEIKNQKINGNILYVGGTGPDNYTTIQDAINHAADGDTVYVFDDSSPYYENVVVNKSINLIGEDKATTIIEGNKNSSTVKIEGNFVVVSNFKFQEKNEYSKYGILSVHSDDNKILNNIFYPYVNRYGITVSNSENNIISENIFNGFYTDGIKLKNSNNSFISKNIFDGEDSGITISDSNNNIITSNELSGIFFIGIFVSGKNNIISENTISHSDDSTLAAGIKVVDYQGPNLNIIFKNKISSCENGIIVVGFSIIEENTISLCKRGIWLLNGDVNSISSNIIRYNDVGIYVYFGSFNKIWLNTFNNNNIGIAFLESDKNNISNNIFSNNTYGVHIYDECSQNIISDNMFSNDGIIIRFNAYPNTFSNNFVNGKQIIYLYDEFDKSISEDAGQIILVKCKNIIIHNTEISDTAVGILAISSNDCEFNNNKLSDNNGYGIYLTGSNNKIYRNDFRNNKNGLFWKGAYNRVEENNFIGNNVDASFLLSKGILFTNRWIRNYWDKTGIFIKIISGEKEFSYYDRFGEVITSSFRWFGIDWNPAKGPYDI